MAAVHATVLTAAMAAEPLPPQQEVLDHTSVKKDHGSPSATSSATTGVPSESSASASPAGSSISALSSIAPVGPGRDVLLALHLVSVIQRCSAGTTALSQPPQPQKSQTPRAGATGKPPFGSERAVKVLAKCLRLLRACQYEWEDIELILAHALAYLEGIAAGLCKHRRPMMQFKEATYGFCLLAFIAHAYVEDSNCPLQAWHKHLFRDYCSLSLLNRAVIGFMEKLGYVLRVQPDDLEEKRLFLRQAKAQ